MTGKHEIALRLLSDAGSIYLTKPIFFSVQGIEFKALARFQIYPDGTFDVNDWSTTGHRPDLDDSDIDDAFYRAIESEEIKRWAFGVNQQRIANYIEELKAYAEDLGKADIMTLAERNR